MNQISTVIVVVIAIFMDVMLILFHLLIDQFTMEVIID